MATGIEGAGPGLKEKYSANQLKIWLLIQAFMHVGQNIEGAQFFFDINDISENGFTIICFRKKTRCERQSAARFITSGTVSLQYFSLTGTSFVKTTYFLVEPSGHSIFPDSTAFSNVFPKTIV